MHSRIPPCLAALLSHPRRNTRQHPIMQARRSKREPAIDTSDHGHAAASRFHHWRLWNTGSPRSSRAMTVVGVDCHCEEPTGRANARPMTDSATKQSIVTVAPAVDCFASLAMTVGVAYAPRNDGRTDSIFKQPAVYRHGFAISPRLSREVCLETSRPPNQRAQGMPGARCTGRLACKIAKKRTRAYRFSGGNPAFPAQWFYGLLRALPGDQACLTPSSALLIADLTPASGRQNDTTWPYAKSTIRQRRRRVHRMPPRVDDVAQRPSVG